jgi:hypothetical protein
MMVEWSGWRGGEWFRREAGNEECPTFSKTNGEKVGQWDATAGIAGIAIFSSRLGVNEVVCVKVPLFVEAVPVTVTVWVPVGTGGME